MHVSILGTPVLKGTVRKVAGNRSSKTELLHWAFQLDSQIDLDEGERAKIK